MANFDRIPPKISSILGPLVLLLAMAAAPLAMAEPRHVRWTPDFGLEDQMEALKQKGHYCLPPPYALNFDPYVVKLAESLYDNCVVGNANEEQVKKYAVLAAVSMSPAAVYSVPYTVSELKTDALKCVLKSFVGVSAMNSTQQAAYKSDIDDMSTLNDWRKFYNGAAGISKTSGQALDAAMTQTTLSANDRFQDTDMFSRAYATVAGGRTLRFLKELWWEEWVVALDEYDFNIDQCRFEDARLAVQRAEDTADADCQALGHTYRTLESELVSKIVRTYNTLDRDLIGDSPNTITIVNDLNRQKRALEQAGEALRSYVQVFAEIKKKRDVDLTDHIKAFEKARLAYEAMYRDALDGLDTPQACRSFTDLETGIKQTLADLNKDSHSCREALFGGYDGSLRLSPNTLRNALLQVARLRSSDWWVKMDQIWNAQHTCDMETALDLRGQLLAEVTSNPIYRVADGACIKQDQPALMAKLNAVAAPDHCDEAPYVKVIPHEIIGQSVEGARKLLKGDDDFFVVPNAKDGDPAQGGQDIGKVQSSRPAPGVAAERGSTVQLFVATGSAGSDTVCPDKNPDPSGDFHKFGQSGPDDGTYVFCDYFEDGRLSRQTPFVDNLRHGPFLNYDIQPACDRFLYLQIAYEKSEPQTALSHKCSSTTGEPGSGTVHRSVANTYVNGRVTLHTEFYPNDKKRYRRTTDLDGNLIRSESWNPDGKPTDCTQYDKDGNKTPCSQ